MRTRKISSLIQDWAFPFGTIEVIHDLASCCLGFSGGNVATGAVGYECGVEPSCRSAIDSRHLEHASWLCGGGVDLRLFGRPGTRSQSAPGRAVMEPVGRTVRRRHCLHHALQRTGAWGSVVAVVLLVGAVDEFVDLGPVWPDGIPAAIGRGSTVGGLGVGGRRGGTAAASALVLKVDNQGGVVGGFSDFEFRMRLPLFAVHLDVRHPTVQACREQGMINTQPIIFREA